MLVADALAMPVHWYYQVAAIKRDYGYIRDYQARGACCLLQPMLAHHAAPYAPHDLPC